MGRLFVQPGYGYGADTFYLKKVLLVVAAIALQLN